MKNAKGRIRCHSICPILAVIVFFFLFSVVGASAGDKLPEFRACVKACEESNCRSGEARLPLHLRLMLWTCPQECDQTCQRVTIQSRLQQDPPLPKPYVQFHGKWLFHRFLGMQEPCSVLFSLLNYIAHQKGIRKVRASIPANYPLRPYYLVFGYFGLVSWLCSMIFHARDFNLTEKMDYFAAGASVFYGLYFATIRIFRLDRPAKATTLRTWTLFCLALYVAHVSYLSFWKWNYTYNMAANVVAGIAQNIMWSQFSIARYRKMHKAWAAWPGLIVAWIVLAMSFELLDFPPILGLIDAHSLWHLGTVLPTYWWYNFLVKDATEDIAGGRLKA